MDRKLSLVCSTLDLSGQTKLVIRQVVPPFPLSQFVDCLWVHSHYTPAHARERVLPTGAMDLVFALGAEGRAASSVSGARSVSVDLDTSRPFSAIGVHFRPGGGLPFFGIPSSELRNQSVPLDQLWGTFAAGIADRLWEADTATDQFRILQDMLLQRGRSRLTFHRAVRYAVDVIDRSRGARSVNAVAGQIGMSPRRFLDVFQSHVGLSPTAFGRVRRFAAVLERIERVPHVEWAEIALSCGYFDQSHFNHDFREFAGVTPSAYLRDRLSPTHLLVTP